MNLFCRRHRGRGDWSGGGGSLGLRSRHGWLGLPHCASVGCVVGGDFIVVGDDIGEIGIRFQQVCHGFFGIVQDVANLVALMDHVVVPSLNPLASSILVVEDCSSSMGTM